MKCDWLPDKLIAGLGDEAILVSGVDKVEVGLFESYKQCRSQAVLCTNQTRLLDQFSAMKQVLMGIRTPPNLHLFTPDDAVLKAGFQLSDILRIVEISKTSFPGAFVIFDSSYALLFLSFENNRPDKVLQVTSSYAIAYLNAALEKTKAPGRAV